MSQIRTFTLCNRLTSVISNRAQTLSSTCVLDYSTNVPRKKTKQKLRVEHRSSSKPTGTPLIVKMMALQNSADDVQEEMHDKSNVIARSDLQSQLLEIRHDFRANIINAEQIPQESTAYDYESNEHDADKSSEIKYVESVILDEDKFTDTADNSKYNSMIGTPMPGTGFSNVPCSGCGALLHCEDPLLPGYVHGKRFTASTTEELKTSVCQRCHLILFNNLCLDVKVDAKDYAKIISTIKTTNPLLIVMVDLLDMENSIFPNLLRSVGKYKQLVIVGNKIDLIPKDKNGYLERVKQSLINACYNAGLDEKNIKHVALISAKTGYGLEELITKLLMKWGIQGDVYLLGSTNTGKSTLFNALLQSDYCKSNVRDLIHRATTSIWSGTTLNLLKFPIINPQPWRIDKRVERLMKARTEDEEESRLRKMSAVKENKSYAESILTGKVKTTNFTVNTLESSDDVEPSGQDFVSFERIETGEYISKAKKSDETEGKPTYSDFEGQLLNVKWLYDTPGVMKTEQIVNILKDEEVKRITPKRRLIPRVYMLKPNEVMFISGLGRMDYIQGSTNIYVTVFTERHIPVFFKKYQDADSFYIKHMDRKKFMLPKSTADHLPSLIGQEFKIVGRGTKSCTADVQLSSIGWISLAIQMDEVVRIRAYTPGGYGCHLREQPLLPYYKTFQGARIKGTNRFEALLPNSVAIK